MKQQKGFSAVEVLLIIVIAAITGLAGWYVWSRNHTDNSSAKQPSSIPQTSELANNNFGSKGDYGMFQATGYATTVKISDTSADCGMSNPGVECPKIDAIFFVITKTDNQKIIPYIAKNQVADSPAQSFMIGCPQNGEIRYQNSSDEEQGTNHTISAADTKQLLAASKDSPIRLEITKDKNSSGKDAPVCYSDFSTYTIIR